MTVRAAAVSILLRGAALFAGVFLLIGLLAGLGSPALDSSHWLVDVRALPGPLRIALLTVSAAAVVWWGVRGGRRTWGRALAVGALAALAVAATLDAARVLVAAAGEGVRLGVPPLSLGLALLFAVAAWRARRPAPAHAGLVVGAAGGSAAAFAVALMVCFGSTDYRRPADAVVVLGARAYADGRASLALSDRVRTAAALVREGRAPLLVVSGGPGDGAYHETDVMRRIAVEEGVSPACIVSDPLGLSTRATARNSARLLRDRGVASALVVSHGYHLPRVKSAFDAESFRVFTVPANESRMMAKLPWFVARETAAWWAYWLRDRLG